MSTSNPTPNTTSLITNPSIVKSALEKKQANQAKQARLEKPLKKSAPAGRGKENLSNGQTGQNGQNGQKKKGKAGNANTLPTPPPTDSTVLNDGQPKRRQRKQEEKKDLDVDKEKKGKSNSNSKPSPPESPPKSPLKSEKSGRKSKKSIDSSTPVTPENSSDDLKKILFPDLFGEGGSLSGNQKVRKSKSNDNAKTTPPSVVDSTKLSSSPPSSSVFAGSSFHSSPAPSALPRPSFKLKSVSSSAPPQTSILDQFMMADKQEREQKKLQSIPLPHFTSPPLSKVGLNNTHITDVNANTTNAGTTTTTGTAGTTTTTTATPTTTASLGSPISSPIQQQLHLAQSHPSIPGMSVPHFPQPPASSIVPTTIPPPFNYSQYAPSQPGPGVVPPVSYPTSDLPVGANIPPLIFPYLTHPDQLQQQPALPHQFLPHQFPLYPGHPLVTSTNYPPVVPHIPFTTPEYTQLLHHQQGNQEKKASA